MDPVKTLYDLGEQQRRVIEFVWQRPGASVRQVWEKLSPDRRLAYTSVLSTMQKLESAGWLRHERKGRQYRYWVTQSRPEAEREALAKFVEQVYGGDPAPLIFRFLRTAESTGAPTLKSLVALRRKVG